MDIKIYAEELDCLTYDTIKQMSFSSEFASSTIRIMPDAHQGKGCVIGFTCKEFSSIRPEWVGVDIGCGVAAFQLKPKKNGKNEIDFKKLNDFISSNMHNSPYCKEARTKKAYLIENLSFVDSLHPSVLNDWNAAIGTIGGGNHFIEIAKDEEGHLWLVIHTGSRTLGAKVAEWHTNVTREFGSSFLPVSVEYENYSADMLICLQWAEYNRNTIGKNIARFLDMDIAWTISSVHNYIKDGIIRKGAISADEGEECVIPINGRDGTLLCRGKGNIDWNFSAPHGAGRLYSRSKSKELFTNEMCVESMGETLTFGTVKKDETPLSYRSMKDIKRLVAPTVDVFSVLKPVYNYK